MGDDVAQNDDVQRENGFGGYIFFIGDDVKQYYLFVLLSHWGRCDARMKIFTEKKRLWKVHVLHDMFLTLKYI